jgi:hypothetical protein
MVEDNYMAEWFEAESIVQHADVGPYPQMINFTDLEDYLVAKLLWQTEMCLGAISTKVCENVGDDDRSVLEHNFACIVREALSAKR